MQTEIRFTKGMDTSKADKIPLSAELLNLVQQIVLTLKKLNVPEEPAISATGDGGIDLNWEEKKVFCTLSKELIFTMGNYSAEMFANIRTEDDISLDV